MDGRKMEGEANSFEFVKSCKNSNVLNRLVRSEKARSYEFATKNIKSSQLLGTRKIGIRVKWRGPSYELLCITIIANHGRGDPEVPPTKILCWEERVEKCSAPYCPLCPYLVHTRAAAQAVYSQFV